MGDYNKLIVNCSLKKMDDKEIEAPVKRTGATNRTGYKKPYRAFIGGKI